MAKETYSEDYADSKGVDTEESTEVESVYNPEEDSKDVIERVYSRFRDCVQVRRMPYPELDDMNLTDYINESRKRANNYLYPREPDEVGFRVFFGEARNKRNIIAAFVAAQRPRVEISARGKNATKTDKRISTILRNTYDYFMEKENADEKYLDWCIDTLDVGTGVLHEYYDYEECEKKFVKKIDKKTGEYIYEKKKIVKHDEALCEVVPIEDIYFPTFYARDVQDLPYLIRRRYILRSIAEGMYKHFPNWEFVPKKPLKTVDNDKLASIFYYKEWVDRVEEPYVEVLEHWDVMNDCYDIVVNGVLLTMPDTPFLEDHKEFPFVFQYYEKNSGFLIGKSLPMKNFSVHDSYNELMNSNLNRSRRSSQIAFVSSTESEIEQDSVGAFEVVKIKDDANFRELRVEGVKAGDINYADHLLAAYDRGTVDKSMSGSVSGETATAIINARAQNIQNLGIYLIYIYAAVRRHAMLRLQNIVQFWFNSNLKGDAFKEKEINIEDAKLADGTKGIRIIRVVSSKKKIPSKKIIDQEKIDKGTVIGIDGKPVLETNYEIVYITPDDIRDIEMKTKVIAGSSLPDMQSLRKALYLEFINAAQSPFFQGLPDPKGVWDGLVEAFGLNPDDVTVEQDMNAQAQAMGGTGNPQIDQLMQAMAQKGQPQGNIEKTSPLVQDMTGTGMKGLNQMMA